MHQPNSSALQSIRSAPGSKTNCITIYNWRNLCLSVCTSSFSTTTLTLNKRFAEGPGKCRFHCEVLWMSTSWESFNHIYFFLTWHEEKLRTTLRGQCSSTHTIQSNETPPKKTELKCYGRSYVIAGFIARRNEEVPDGVRSCLDDAVYKSANRINEGYQAISPLSCGQPIPLPLSLWWMASIVGLSACIGQ